MDNQPTREEGDVIPFIELLNTVRALSEEYPERVITEPVYWDFIMDCPGDIVGTALYRLDVGVPLEWNNRDVVSIDWARLGFSVAFGPQLKWLQLVQDFGAQGLTWGQAVFEADGKFSFVPQLVAS